MSYEADSKDKIDKKEPIPGKLNISVLRYFWQASPIFGNKKNTIPDFLRNVKVFKNFTENELRILANFLHLRNFSADEVVFEQNDVGVGCFLIYSGNVHVFSGNQFVAALEKYDLFGELALVQEGGLRSATAIAKNEAVLLGLFKPDLELLMEDSPLIATKFFQSISLTIANRFTQVTQDIQTLKNKYSSNEKA